MSAADGWIMLEGWRAAALAVMIWGFGYIVGRMVAWYNRRKDVEDLIDALDEERKQEDDE